RVEAEVALTLVRGRDARGSHLGEVEADDDGLPLRAIRAGGPGGPNGLEPGGEEVQRRGVQRAGGSAVDDSARVEVLDLGSDRGREGRGVEAGRAPDARPPARERAPEVSDRVPDGGDDAEPRHDHSPP